VLRTVSIPTASTITVAFSGGVDTLIASVQERSRGLFDHHHAITNAFFKVAASHAEGEPMSRHHITREATPKIVTMSARYLDRSRSATVVANHLSHYVLDGPTFPAGTRRAKSRDGSHRSLVRALPMFA